MFLVAASVILAAGAVPESVETQADDPPCAAAPDSVGCFMVHGRMRWHNGNPTFRIWPVGTDRLLGVRDRDGVVRMPKALLEAVILRPPSPVMEAAGAFLVCPLTEAEAGEMQMVCVESASNLSVAPAR